MTEEPQTPLIVAAMPSELRHALDVMTGTAKKCLGPWSLWCGELDGRPAALLLTGIGMVNAGAALARSLCEIQPSSVINFGCAGAHRADMMPGDVVIGVRYVHHRAVTILSTGEERFSGSPIDPDDPSCFVRGFDAAPALLCAATKAAEGWELEPWQTASSGSRPPAVLTGPLTSADVWTQATDHIQNIHSEHGTFCEDMEAAALAQIAAMHRIPFIAIKDISNNEFNSETEHGEAGPTLDGVQREVGRRSFALVRRMLASEAF
jgi:adenosylhomocysteine nucleosidase